jgi:F420-dependent oxidoreductase-like protein
MAADHPVRLGLKLSPQNCTIEDLRGVWRVADDAGFDHVWGFDHFNPIFSDLAGDIFEGWSLLAAMAERTQRVRIGLMVTGNTYRHPAVLAKMAVTVDHLSGGRIEFGLGAAWFELEHEQYGIPFPRIGVRMDMLDEACRVARGLWTQETTTFEGRHFRLHDARCEPKPVQERLPLVIGGSGERRTLRIVAEHADIWNTFYGDEDEFRHKLGVLAGHCADVGRDPADVRVSLTFRAVLRDSEREAADAVREVFGEVMDNPRMQKMLIAGTPEQCAERLGAFRDLGAGDFLLGTIAPGDPRTLELLAREVAPAMRRC